MSQCRRTSPSFGLRLRPIWANFGPESRHGPRLGIARPKWANIGPGSAKAGQSWPIFCSTPGPAWSPSWAKDEGRTPPKSATKSQGRSSAKIGQIWSSVDKSAFGV